MDISYGHTWAELLNLQELANTVLTLLLVFVTGYLVPRARKALERWIDDKDLSITNKYLLELNDLVWDVASATTQTYVSELKDKGVFDRKAQREAFLLTRDAVKHLMSDGMKRTVAGARGDLDDYLRFLIEAAVANGVSKADYTRLED